MASKMASPRASLLKAMRERNIRYGTCRSMAEETQDLANEVSSLRTQLHKLEQEALLVQSAGDANDSVCGTSVAGGGGTTGMPGAAALGVALRHDALQLSPSLWPRLAYGALQALPPAEVLQNSSPGLGEFCSAVHAVCGRTLEDSSTVVDASDNTCSGQRHNEVAQGMTLDDVICQFLTHIVRAMLAVDNRVNARRLRRHEEDFRRVLLEACISGDFHTELCNALPLDCQLTSKEDLMEVLAKTPETQRNSRDEDASFFRDATKPVNENMIEYQRKVPFKGFSNNHLFPNEPSFRRAFPDGTSVALESMDVVLPEGWVWTEEDWCVLTGGQANDTGTDKDGWMYAFNWGTYVGKEQTGHFVRRRLLSRTRVLTVNPTAQAGVAKNAAGSGVEDLTQLFAQHGLADICKRVCQELGASVAADLKVVEKEDVDALVFLTPIQRRKLFILVSGKDI